MAKHSGGSHALAAVAALVVGDLLTRTIAIVVDQAQLEGAITALADSLVVSWLAIEQAIVEQLLLIALIAVFAFVWGYLYHLRRHGRDSRSGRPTRQSERYGPR